VVDSITILQKKKENILKSSKLENIVNGVTNTLCTKNLNFKLGVKEKRRRGV